MNNENSVDKVVSYVSQAPSIATTTTNASYETNHRRGAVSTIVNTNECNDSSI